MPEPSSARRVSRASNVAVSPMYSITESGTPRSASSERRMSFSAGSFIA